MTAVALHYHHCLPVARTIASHLSEAQPPLICVPASKTLQLPVTYRIKDMPDMCIQKTPKYEPQLLYIQIIFQDIPRPIHNQIAQIYLKVLEFLDSSTSVLSIKIFPLPRKPFSQLLSSIKIHQNFNFYFFHTAFPDASA